MTAAQVKMKLLSAEQRSVRAVVLKKAERSYVIYKLILIAQRTITLHTQRSTLRL